MEHKIMTKEDIIRMAREAGLPVSDKFDGIGYVWCSDEYPIDELLQRFANLVAAAEREACAKYLEGYATKFNDIRSAALEVVAEHLRARGQE